jgi:hypothetical protein
MFDTTKAVDLRGKRIKIQRIDGDAPTGVLRGITPDALWLDETKIWTSEIQSVSEAPLHCANCGANVLKLFDGYCASCYREAAKKQPRPVEECEVCGAKPAFRSPSAGGDMPFLCTIHHAERGTLKVHPANPVMADCTTEDVSSPKHEWQQVRGARFRCIRCLRAEKWDTELLADIKSRNEWGKR